MKLKLQEKRINQLLWFVYIVAVLYVIVYAIKEFPPSYETFNTENNISYEYTDKNGQKEISELQLAWYHPQYNILIPLFPQNSEMRFYDPAKKQVRTIKDEYIAEYKEIMPPSNIPRWKHWMTLLVILSIIILSFGIYQIGVYLRDIYLYNRAKSHNDFSSFAYFLFKDRKSKTQEAQQAIRRHANTYIKANEPFFDRINSPALANLLKHFISQIAVTGNTKIPFYYTHVNNAKQHKEYLKDLSFYWESQIGKNDKAESNRDQVDALRNKTYETIYVGDKTVPSKEVEKILTDLFVDVYGEEIIKFEVYKGPYDELMKRPNALFVKTFVENSVNTFTWSGSDHNKSIPGIAIRFTIYVYENGKPVNLWNQFLEPVCTYTAESFCVADLYKNMISETISSFPKSLKE